ncbi:hypothetical protein KIMH_10430 [Bombiscardovia apis]|uniref:Cell surface protein n=1 Tax=Bombiscardovia apis TaxID=2932182 RepID=A0ABM8BDF9_9BIFI|nr:DUF6466 family protein [Bombiscardovia apis]BDR54932.1 hypothetical protein KIMH_10430 [Bombiscardovia apis]
MTAKRPHSSRQPRAKLWLRIVIALFALILLLLGAVSLLNARAVNVYNEASASLSNNLKAAAQPQADIDKLLASQQQVDALFTDAEQSARLLLPATKDSIAHNAQLSRQLSKALTQQQQIDNPGAQQNGANADKLNRHSSQQQQGLSQEQRQQVEEMLKRNQELQNANPQPSARPSTQPSPGQVKPW